MDAAAQQAEASLKMAKDNLKNAQGMTPEQRKAAEDSLAAAEASNKMHSQAATESIKVGQDQMKAAGAQLGVN